MSNYNRGVLEDWLPTIIYPSTVADEQARLKAALDGTNTAVNACASLDPTTKTTWGLFYASANGFCNEKPGLFGLGSMMDRAQKYEDELVSWQTAKLTGCAGVVVYSPASNSTSGLQYLAWGVGAVAGAYIVGKIVSVIPTKRR
jgi:hypothetical protein